MREHIPRLIFHLNGIARVCARLAQTPRFARVTATRVHPLPAKTFTKTHTCLLHKMCYVAPLSG